MHILIATDAWAPQINGVVRTLEAIVRELRGKGHQVTVLSPADFRSVPCPTYPEIRLALASKRAVAHRIAALDPDAIHIATEGPIGLAVRRCCRARALPFTTAYHTNFPDYAAQRTKLPPAWFWRYITWFHAAASAVLVSTEGVRRQLAARGIAHTRHWGRGVDLDLFRPAAPRPPAFEKLAQPVQLYVGRVAPEKNVAAFLDADVPGTKIVIGDGPSLVDLKRRYPEVAFLGAMHSEALASAYAAADVFVFPSRTDTFGLTMIEALACGTPVAAYPVQGPVDVLDGDIACLDEDLAVAIRGALGRDRARCAAFARRFSWAASATQFEAALVPVRLRPRLSSSTLLLEPAG